MLSTLRRFNPIKSQINLTRILRPSYSFYSTDYSEVYRDKLLKKAQEYGFDSVEQLKDHLKEQINKQKKEFNKNDPLKALDKFKQSDLKSNSTATATATKISEPFKKPVDHKSGKSNNGTVPFKTLDSYMDLNKLKSLTSQQIEYLWRAKWSTKDNSLVAVIPSGIFNKFYQFAKENPIFVLPLPRKLNNNEMSSDSNSSSKNDNNKNNVSDEGMELHYIQWNFPDSNTSHCILTSLAEYKLHNQFARPHTVLEFHSELSNDMGIVLMNGQVEEDCNVTLQDAHYLLLNIQRFYGAMGTESKISQERLDLLKQFNRGSKEFNVDKLIELSQSMEN